MKQITVVCPVNFNTEKQTYSFKPNVEYTVPDDVAGSTYLAQFLKTVLDIKEDSIPEPVEEQVQEEKPKRTRGSRNAKPKQSDL